jgi:curved DNA-binding protein CbpA
LKAPGKANAAAEFRRVNETYEPLKDEEAKARYDRQYSNVQVQWTKYNTNLDEYSQHPDAWRKKQSSAARAQFEAQAQAQAQARSAASQRTQTHYYYDDSDDSEWEYEEFESGFLGLGSVSTLEGVALLGPAMPTKHDVLKRREISKNDSSSAYKSGAIMKRATTQSASSGSQ